MCGWQVKLCDPFVTHGPYLSTLEIRVGIIKCYINSPSLLYQGVWKKVKCRAKRVFVIRVILQHAEASFELCASGGGEGLGGAILHPCKAVFGWVKTGLGRAPTLGSSWVSPLRTCRKFTCKSVPFKEF